MKLLKVLGLAIIPLLAISLSSCGQRALFGVQIQNDDAWNDTFYTALLRESVSDLIYEAILADDLDFNYGVTGENGDEARKETSGYIEELLMPAGNIHEIFAYHQRHSAWDIELEVMVQREDDVFAFRSIVILVLRDVNPRLEAEFTFDANFFIDANIDEELNVSYINDAINEEVALRSIEFSLRQTANERLVRNFVLDFINGYFNLSGNNKLVLKNLEGSIVFDFASNTISWTIGFQLDEEPS